MMTTNVLRTACLDLSLSLCVCHVDAKLYLATSSSEVSSYDLVVVIFTLFQ